MPKERAMESTTPSGPTTSLPVTVRSLTAAFATIPDPRPALLGMAVAALLCDHTSVLAISEWGARQDADCLADLGFVEGRTPCQSTLHRLLSKVDVRALAAALRTAFERDGHRAR